MKPTQYADIYPVIIDIKKNTPGITAKDVKRVLMLRGYKESEIPSISSIRRYKVKSIVPVNLKGNIKRTAKELHKKGLTVSAVRAKVNEMYDVKFKLTVYNNWINGRKKTKQKKATPAQIRKECGKLISSQELHINEAIDWMAERGVTEDDAIDFVMARFSGGTAINTSPTVLKEYAPMRKPSKQRKAA